MQITINPAEENPSTLRAVALLLSSIASDRDGGPKVEVSVHNNSGKEVKLTVSDLPANPGNAHDAPGASDQSQIPPPPPLTGATAQTDNTGSDNSDLDVNGLPWDARIHSSSKNKNQDGTWRYTRGGDPVVRAQVEAELRAKGPAGGQPAQQDASATALQSPAADTPPPPPPLNNAPADQTPPPPPPLAEQQADAPSVTQVTMQEVFSRANKMPLDQRTMALEVVGLASMSEFLKEYKVRPELAGELNAALSAVSGEE